MASELDQILISYDQPDFRENLRERRKKSLLEKYQPFGTPESNQNLNLVRQIVWDVAQRGDKAVAEYTKKYDDVDLKPEEFLVSQAALEEAHKKINNDLLKSICQAIENVKKYQKEILIDKEKTPFGIKYTPIKRVGICVPGASAPLPSTVIMCAVPAQVAGVEEIVAVSPPKCNDSIHPDILAVCHELKIDKVYRIGGAQAVAALAWGTETINKVDKIVGPGNWWVQMAKREAFGYVGVDSVAGPSEVLIIANEKANPAWVAADMLSQVEHTPGLAWLLTNSKKFAAQVLDAINEQIKQLLRPDEITKSLKEYSAVVIEKNMEKLIENANDFAAEHLEIQCGDESRKIADQIENAGAIFIGDYSPVAVGDYWAGPSHTLPTGTSAKFFSALSANDFIKSTSIIEYSKEKLAESADDIIRLAEAEGLDAHARSVQIRQQK